MENKYYVYVLKCKEDNSIYIGFTRNLAKRLWEHKNKLSNYTKSKNDWELLWYCVFDNENNAINFEKYLKSHSGRIFIKRRINPTK